MIRRRGYTAAENPSRTALLMDVGSGAVVGAFHFAEGVTYSLEEALRAPPK